jgi:hypothetical protein
MWGKTEEIGNFLSINPCEMKMMLEILMVYLRMQSAAQMIG